MSKKYPGGIITKSPATPTGPVQTGSAPGVWTMDQAAYWIKQGVWPTAGLTNYWLGTQSGNQVTASVVDTSGNVYYFTQPGLGTIAKYGPYGNLIWAKNFSAGTSIYDAVIDSSNAIYVCGQTSNEFFVAKLTTDGAITWQTQTSTTYGGTGYGIAVASSGNVYAVGWINTFNNADAVTFKFNSSGTLQWQRYSYSAQYDQFYKVAVDSSENVYAVGQSFNAGSPVPFQLIKYNSSGTVLTSTGLQVTVSGFPQTTYAQSITINQSTGDVYIAGYYGSGSSRATVVKYNSSLTFQWGRYIGDPSASQYDIFYDVILDSSGNVYVAGQTDATVAVTGYRGALIAKYNSSGTLQWQRSLATNKQLYANTITTSGVSMVLGGYQDGGSVVGWVMDAPNDGTFTKTYTIGGVSYYYNSTSFTNGTASYGTGSFAMTNGTPSYSFTTPTLSLSNTTITATIVGMS